MSNLKKILALVLALVMSMSVLTVASAAESTDDVKAEYAEAVEILQGIEVFRGYEDGTFKPQNSITRAEVAAIIYRIDTGDVNDKQVKIYSDYNRFDDVKSTAWYAGYVNYCANAEYIKGYDENTFGPNDKVTGYQALAMILRVVGYDKNNEFSGSAWQIEVAKYANKLGITANVNANTLGVAATRELIAELLWRTIYTVPQVTYTLALGYNQYNDLLTKDELNNTINEDMFQVAPFSSEDAWGRPTYGWTKFTGKWNEATIVFNYVTPNYDGYTAITECDVAVYMGLKKTTTWYEVDLRDNGYEYQYTWNYNSLHNDKHDKDEIVGEQGTYIAVYGYPYYRVVLIDTYLAQVTDVITEKTDKAGHIEREAQNEITVFVGEDRTATYMIDGNEYAKGTYLLAGINYYRTYNQDGSFRNWATRVMDLRAPATVDGKQTKIWWNAEKHTITGADYMDNVNYYLDEAEFDKNGTYTWFFDEQNNVIGSVEVITPVDVSYAVVLDAQWFTPAGTYGYCEATLQYMNGEIVKEKIYAVNGNVAQYADAWNANFEMGKISTNWDYNKNTEAHLYAVTKSAYGLVLDTRGMIEIGDTVDADGNAEHVCIKKGVSKIVNPNAADEALYNDNNTLFVYWVDTNADGYVDSLEFVTGYDNLPKNLHGLNVDVLQYDGYPFTTIVYVPTQVAHNGPALTAEKYVYITNKSTTDILGSCFTVNGVIDAEGNTAPLLFLLNAYGTEQETATALDLMVEMYKDSLVKVTYYVSNGIVADVAPIDYVVESEDAGYATFANGGQYTFLDTGVLKFNTNHSEAGVALNVNKSTVIINEDGNGITVNDLKELLKDNEKQNLYVVYNETKTAALAIFVTSDNVWYDFYHILDNTVYGAANQLTYTVGDDTFVTALNEAVSATLENSELVNLVELITRNDVVVLGENTTFRGLSEDGLWAQFVVAVTCEGYVFNFYLWVPSVALAE